MHGTYSVKHEAYVWTLEVEVSNEGSSICCSWCCCLQQCVYMEIPHPMPFVDVFPRTVNVCVCVHKVLAANLCTSCVVVVFLLRNCLILLFFFSGNK